MSSDSATVPDTERGRAIEQVVLPEAAVEAMARFSHDRNNNHGWYDPECLQYPEDHREPYARLYARAALSAVMAAGFYLVSAGSGHPEVRRLIEGVQHDPE